MSPSLLVPEQEQKVLSLSSQSAPSHIKGFCRSAASAWQATPPHSKKEQLVYLVAQMHHQIHQLLFFFSVAGGGRGKHISDKMRVQHQLTRSLREFCAIV